MLNRLERLLSMHGKMGYVKPLKRAVYDICVSTFFVVSFCSQSTWGFCLTAASLRPLALPTIEKKFSAVLKITIVYNVTVKRRYACMRYTRRGIKDYFLTRFLIREASKAEKHRNMNWFKYLDGNEFVFYRAQESK